MKNFLQVNRALKAKKNFNFNFKHLLVLSAVLLLGSTQVWGTATTTSLCPASDLTPGKGVITAFYSADPNIDDSVYVGRAGGSSNIYTVSGVSKANSIVFKLKNTATVYFTQYNNNGASKTTSARFVSINENDYKAIKSARKEAPSTRISTTVNGWSSSADAIKKGIYDYLKDKYASLGSDDASDGVLLGKTLTTGISAAYGTSTPTDSTFISITSNKGDTRYFVFGDPTAYTTTASALNSPKATLPAGCYILEIYTTQNTVGITAITTEAVDSCTAPSSVTVDATGGIDGNYGWRYTTGETIDLTCTATGGSGEYSYQWQKYVNSAWTDIIGATSARYQKASCTYNDGGSYRCVVSTGEGCSKSSDEALGH